MANIINPPGSALLDMSSPYRRIRLDSAREDGGGPVRQAHWRAHCDAIEKLMGLSAREDAPTEESNAVLYFARDLEQVSAESLDVLRYPLMGRQLMPFVNELTPGADTFSYDMYNVTSQAKWISNWATIVGDATAEKVRISIPTRYFGNGYSYSVADLERAAFARGKNPGNRALDAEKARANRMSHEEFLDNLVANGDSTREIPGLPGILDDLGFTIGAFDPPNMGGATPVPYIYPTEKLYTSGTFDGTGPQIVRALNELCMVPQMNTKGTFKSNRLVLPLSYKSIMVQPYSNTILDGKTIEAVFLQNQPADGIKSIDYWHVLDTASAGGGPRALAYFASPRTFKFVLAYDYKELPVQVTDGAYRIASYALVAGVVAQYPLAMAVCDLDDETGS